MSSIRENKKVMGGIAAGLGLIAIILLGRGLLGGSSGSEVPTQTQAASEEVVQQLREANQGQPQVEEPLPERGIGRRVTPPQ